MSETTQDPAVVHASDADFAALIAGTELPVFVDFYADWCGPCRIMEPVLEVFGEEHRGRAIVVKLDTDANPFTTMMYGIRGIPTLVVFRAGKEVLRQVGAVPKRHLEAMLTKTSKPRG